MMVFTEQVHTYKHFQPYLKEDAVYFIEDITPTEKMPNYIHDCLQFNPDPKHGRIAVIRKHEKPLKQAGLDLIDTYREKGELK